MQPAPPTKRTKVFISYKRDTSPDEPLARLTYQRLKEQGFDVFIDQESIEPGDDWANTIVENINESHVLLAFTSPESILSEMFQDEVDMAHRAKLKNGSPIIIPIRLAYDAPFPHPLSSYLKRIQWLVWKGEADTEPLMQKLVRAVHNRQVEGDARPVTPPPPDEPLPPPFPSAQIELEDGTLDPASCFYAVRWVDEMALQLIQQQGKTLVIKGPRQVGKSSLLMRIKERAQGCGKQVALIDFQIFDDEVMESKEVFFSQFFEALTDALELENRIEQVLAEKVGGALTLRCTKYMEKHVLQGLGQPLLLAMDEVERLFGTTFQTDFFRMLRAWHSSRAQKQVWKRLDMALITSTEPQLFIKNPYESPFNVGFNLEPQDFSEADVLSLIERHLNAAISAKGREEVCRLRERIATTMELFGGHPFLVRRALFLAATGQPAQRLFDTAADDDGPFGDHLKRNLRRLHGNDDLVAGMRQVVNLNRCDDDVIFFRLKSAGLVKIKEDETGKDVLGPDGRVVVVPRCGIYERFFNQYLPKEHQA